MVTYLFGFKWLNYTTDRCFYLVNSVPYYRDNFSKAVVIMLYNMPGLCLSSISTIDINVVAIEIDLRIFETFTIYDT